MSPLLLPLVLVDLSVLLSKRHHNLMIPDLCTLTLGEGGGRMFLSIKSNNRFFAKEMTKLLIGSNEEVTPSLFLHDDDGRFREEGSDVTITPIMRNTSHFEAEEIDVRLLRCRSADGYTSWCISSHVRVSILWSGEREETRQDRGVL